MLSGLHDLRDAAPPALPAPPAFHGHGPIEVRAGTYAANCGAPHANKIPPLAAACSGSAQCDHRVDYTSSAIPPSAVARITSLNGAAAVRPVVHRAAAPPEAGFGAVVTLSSPR